MPGPQRGNKSNGQGTSASRQLRPRAALRGVQLSCARQDVNHTSGLLDRVDRIGSNRSAFLERAALVYLDRLEQSDRDRRDIAIINRHARRLNRGVQETLEYQMLP